MQDESKTKAQLIKELRQLRAEAAALTGNHAEKNASAFHEVLEGSLNEIYFIDAQTLKFIQVNYGARLNLGYSQDELEKLTPVDIKPEFTRESFLKLIDPLVTGKRKKVQFTTVHQRKDGSLYPVEINLQPSMLQSHKVFIAIVLDITERRQIENALLQSRNEYRQLFDRMANGFAFHKIETDKRGNPVDYTFLDVNPAFEKITTIKAEDAIGKKVTDAIPGIEDDPANWIRTYGKVALEGKEIHFENYSVVLNKWFSIFAYSPKKGYFATIFEDITERKQAEELLKKSERQMKSIFVAANDAIFIVDPSSDEIVDVNPKAAELLGYSIDNLKGMPMSAVHPEEMDQLSDFVNEVFKQGKGFTNELHCKTKSGAILPAEISASSLQLGDRLLMLAMVRDITERKQAEEKIREMAYHDHLTGLPNRALFYDRLQQSLAHTHRSQKLMGVLMLDLDYFKSVNDELGHEWGDRALIEVGKRLLQCTRATDTVARLGGDEFSIILVDVNSEKAACKIAEKVIATIGRPLPLKKSQYTLGVSIGICMASPDDGSMESLMSKADSAMYQAKKEGRNCYRISEQPLS